MAETDSPAPTQQFAEPKRLMGEIGTSGLRRYAGMVDEEFDPKLKGRRGVQVFETMRRNDPDVGAILLAIKQSLLSIEWMVERGGDSPADEEAAQFLESCLEDMSHSWKDMISDACTMFPFGWAYLEEVYKLRQGPAPGGDKPESEHNDGRIGWRKIVLRGQQSLDRWEFDPNGGIKGMWQRPINGAPVFIPIEKALLFRTDKENNNPEGISLLRNAYRPWFLKSTLEEVEAIGVERDLTGMPVVKLPMGASDEDMTSALNIIARIKTDDQSGVVLPRTGEGEHQAWGFELIQSPGAGKVDTDKLYSRYSIAIARSVLAQFLTLGQGRVGSFALSRDMRDLFHLALKGYLDGIAETLNNFAVKRLFRLNDFKIEKLPKLVPGRMGQRDITILVDAVSKLATMGMPMMPEDWNFIRQEMEMPAIPDEKLEEIEAEREAQREAMLAGLAAGPADDPDDGGSGPSRPTRRPQGPAGDERDDQQSQEGKSEQRRRQTSEAYRYLFSMSEEEENETIRRNRKTPAALNRHRYRAASWTNVAGEPRCLVCGEEEPQNGFCSGYHEPR